MDESEFLNCNSQIYRRVSDRRELNNWFRQQYHPTTDQAEGLRLLADTLTPVFQYLADGYKWGTIESRAWILLYALRPDLVDGHSMTEAGAKFGITRQSMQHQLEVLRDYLPFLHVDTESRRGKESDRSARSERARQLRANGAALKLTQFARRRERISSAP